MSLSLSDDLLILKEFNFSPQLLVGVDEAGRGPLAGPLVVAGVLFATDVVIDGINDSKKLTAKKREELEPIIKDKALAFHIEIIELEMIQKLNIYQASKWGMITCFQEISKKIHVDILLTDAMKISKKELHTNTIPIIKGDSKSFHIAAASILAKRARDEIMCQLDHEYPQYQWKQNKGYPTKNHRENIKKYGITPYHRKNYKLI